MTPLNWITRDGKLVLAAKGIRSFGFGFLSVILLIYFSAIGFGVLLGGILLSLILLGGVIFTLLGSFFADRIGRRTFLVIMAILMTFSGLVYAVTTNLALLLLVSILGTLSPSGGDIGAYQSIEQAILPQTCSREKRNSAYAIYNMIGRLTSSSGALLSGLPALLAIAYHLGALGSYRPLFITYAILATANGFAYVVMSKEVESPANEKPSNRVEQKISLRSKNIIAKLSLLMGVDSFAGGFVLQTIVSYWFYVRFSVSVPELSAIFFVTGVLSSVAFIVAGRLADRIGAINTMVFTHLPSSVLLLLVPIVPSFFLSVGLYIARQPLSMMDIPARQAYTMSVVEPSERTFAAGMSNVASNVGRGISPSITGAFMQLVSFSSPFFICSVLKIAYDLSLYANFRKVKELDSESLNEKKSQ